MNLKPVIVYSCGSMTLDATLKSKEDVLVFNRDGEFNRLQIAIELAAEDAELDVYGFTQQGGFTSLRHSQRIQTVYISVHCDRVGSVASGNPGESITEIPTVDRGQDHHIVVQILGGWHLTKCWLPPNSQDHPVQLCSLCFTLKSAGAVVE